MNAKLIASGSKITIGDFMQRRGMRVFDHGAQHYTSCCGDEFESGYIMDGVIYPDGKKPRRYLDLIVPGEAAPFKMEIKFEYPNQ